MSQRLPSESLKFTKVWAKVPPKCLKGYPKASYKEVCGGCHAPRNLSACLTFGLHHRANSSQDGFRTWQLPPIKKNIKSRNSSPGSHFVPIPAAFAGAPVGIRWLCDSKFMFETCRPTTILQLHQAWQQKCSERIEKNDV